MTDKKRRPQCFTVKFSGRTNVLISEVNFNDPIANPLEGPPYQFNPKINRYRAIWDTGATNTCISDQIVSALNLQPVGFVKVSTAAGESDQKQYIVDMLLPNNVIFQGITVTGAILPTGAAALVGMDVIGSGDFAVTSLEDKTVFSYRHPNDDCINFVELREREDRTIFDPGGRNNLCRCGSGKKFKDCHGKR